MFADTHGVIRVVEESTVKQTITRGDGCVPTVVCALARLPRRLRQRRRARLPPGRAQRRARAGLGGRGGPVRARGSSGAGAQPGGAPVRGIATCGREGMTALVETDELHVCRVEHLILQEGVDRERRGVSRGRRARWTRPPPPRAPPRAPPPRPRRSSGRRARRRRQPRPLRARRAPPPRPHRPGRGALGGRVEAAARVRRG